MIHRWTIRSYELHKPHRGQNTLRLQIRLMTVAESWEGLDRRHWIQGRFESASGPSLKRSFRLKIAGKAVPSSESEVQSITQPQNSESAPDLICFLESPLILTCLAWRWSFETWLWISDVNHRAVRQVRAAITNLFHKPWSSDFIWRSSSSPSNEATLFADRVNRVLLN